MPSKKKLSSDRWILEKALLKRSTRKPLISALISEMPDGVSSNLEDLKSKLSSAEKDVRDTRREMREWYRGIREQAHSLPELFYLLPDLQVPGSILGDGGFAEKARLPRRRLDEYEITDQLRKKCNVVASDDSKFIQNKSNIKGTDISRHIFLKAKYHGGDVVLKGFAISDQAQREGLERELAILGRLNSDFVIRPRAMVENQDTLEDACIRTDFIEYPYYKSGTLSMWLEERERRPWEHQAIARQILNGLLYLHNHGIIYSVKPSNIYMYEDRRVVLANFEFSEEIRVYSVDEEPSSMVNSTMTGYMAPEVESGQVAVFASDMFSFGVLLLFMHYPTLSFIPGNLRLPINCEIELSDILQLLLVVNVSTRPSASTALIHPYFRLIFAERLMEEGEVIDQERKLEAVNSLLRRIRSLNMTNLESIRIKRDDLVITVLKYFQNMSLDRMSALLRVTFDDEAGIDEGGLLTEMYTIFFESVFSSQFGLFEGSDKVVDGSVDEFTGRVLNEVVLPTPYDVHQNDMEGRVDELIAVGRAMAKALYEGQRIGNKLCSSVFKFIAGTQPTMRDLLMYDPQLARSLQWMLATSGIEEFNLHFDSVDEAHLGLYLVLFPC